MKKVSWGRAELVASYNLEDYPPGTPMPELTAPDLTDVTPWLRPWIRWRMKKIRAMQKARMESWRDDYWRKKANGESRP